MNKLFSGYLFFVISFFPLLISAQAVNDSSVIAQSSNDDIKLTGEELANYEKQARQLVSFMEFAFNTLGSAKAEFKDKHTIIEESYLKFFKDSKVQIEDDLENRDMVTNKDVQAYLKDIDFFFKDVTFKYTIEEINQEINEAGEVFFLIKASRNLKGTALNGKQVNENKPRYIEINIDQSKRDLKIVSVYTTKSNEEQELIAWWNDLDKGWRSFLAGKTTVLDTINLKDVIFLHNDFIVVETLYIDYSDTLSLVDTLRVDQSKILPDVRRILRADEIDISGVEGIYDLKPLYAFTGLKYLNITGAKVPDLDPVRNLSRLESLLAGKSLIISLEPIRYTPNLRILDISATLISDLSPIEDYKSLEVLNIGESRISDLKVVKNLKMLRELNLSRTAVRELMPLSGLTDLQVLEMTGVKFISLDPVSGLVNLKRLVLNETGVDSIDQFTGLQELSYLYIESTQVSSIDELKGLKKLKVIYCDKTPITRNQALAFMQSRPDVKVIYESQELMAWWETLPAEWKEVFSEYVQISQPPTREQLHEISFIRTLDISDNVLITSLEPVEKLSSLSELNLSNTAVLTLKPLANSFDISILKLANTRITDLSPLSAHTSLKELDITRSAITSVQPLIKLPELKVIRMDSVNVSDPSPLSQMRRIETIYADGVPAMAGHVDRIWDSIPNVLIIYQTSVLTNWWKGLTDAWKQVFMENQSFTGEPDRVLLHKIVSVKELDLTKSRNISELSPLNMLRLLEKLNISGLQVTDLGPLASSHRLKETDISNTPVNSLAAIAGHKNLQVLLLANSPVEDLAPIIGFTQLRILDISGTQITKLDPLSGCVNLTELSCYNTRVNNLKPLDQLTNIKVLRAYNTRLSERKIEKFRQAHPGTEVIYY